MAMAALTNESKRKAGKVCKKRSKMQFVLSQCVVASQGVAPYREAEPKDDDDNVSNEPDSPHSDDDQDGDHDAGVSISSLSLSPFEKIREVVRKEVKTQLNDMDFQTLAHSKFHGTEALFQESAFQSLFAAAIANQYPHLEVKTEVTAWCKANGTPGNGRVDIVVYDRKQPEAIWVEELKYHSYVLAFENSNLARNFRSAFIPFPKEADCDVRSSDYIILTR